MSIVRMKKLTAIGMISDRETLMKELMRLGVVQISAQEQKLSDRDWSTRVSLDGNDEAVTRLDQKIAKVSQALDALEKYGTAKKPLIRTRRAIRISEFQRILETKSEIEERMQELLSLVDSIGELQSAENKKEMIKCSLLPWAQYDVPLSFKGTVTTEHCIGAVPTMAMWEKLERLITEKEVSCHVEQVGEDGDQKYWSVLYVKSERELVWDILREMGFNQMQFPGLSKTAAEELTTCQQDLEDCRQRRLAFEQQIQAYEPDRKRMQLYHDDLTTKRELALVRSRLLVTESVFYLEGWFPKQCTEQVEMLLRIKGCYYDTEDPAPEEATPVLMENNRFSSPFESVTKLYALPDSRGIDATPFFSFFYAMFFGMMLSDAAYGAILTIGTFIVMKKFNLEGMMKELIHMFFYCGIATMFWGVMFGGYFGDFISVFSSNFLGKEMTIAPLWFNPLDDPMRLLIFSFVIGTVHLFLGMGLSAYMSIRDGKPWDAVFDVGLWYLLLVGGVMWLCGTMANILGPTPTAVGMWMTIAGAVGILLTGGRKKKGLGKITGGLGSLYNITSYLSDVLSYSRLLALGLATSVISSVVNTLGTLAGDGILGLIVMVIAFVIGHTYNMAINTLGSFVHSCRLQYVEFFGKFYESGGEEFQPFREKTKYVEIIKEDF